MEDSQLGLNQLLLDMPMPAVVEGEGSQEGLEVVNRAEEGVVKVAAAAEGEEVVGKGREEVVVVRSKFRYTSLLLGWQEDTQRQGRLYYLYTMNNAHAPLLLLLSTIYPLL